jgi:hypothetical protein
MFANGKARGRKPARPVPSDSFEETLVLPEAIQRYGSGLKIRRLTLLGEMKLSPSSSATRDLISNSNKYGLTTGSFNTEFLDLTDLGRTATDPDIPAADRLRARFSASISNIPPFNSLFEEYVGKKLPSQEVLKDHLRGLVSEDYLKDTVDMFVVNCQYLGLLKTFGGSEVLVSLDDALDALKRGMATEPRSPSVPGARPQPSLISGSSLTKPDWAKTCFFIAPIGTEGDEQRLHSDLILSHLVEPALKDLGFTVVRADQIGSGGIITSQVIEHVLRCGLAVVDLSFHNPNAFYEMALRHATGLPVIQISRRNDPLPFDVNQVRTVILDTTSIYSLVPKLETYRSEIAVQAKAALADAGQSSNPLTVFFPGVRLDVPG